MQSLCRNGGYDKSTFNQNFRDPEILKGALSFFVGVSRYLTAKLGREPGTKASAGRCDQRTTVSRGRFDSRTTMFEDKFGWRMTARAWR